MYNNYVLHVFKKIQNNSSTHCMLNLHHKYNASLKAINQVVLSQNSNDDVIIFRQGVKQVN